MIGFNYPGSKSRSNIPKKLSYFEILYLALIGAAKSPNEIEKNYANTVIFNFPLLKWRNVNQSPTQIERLRFEF